MHWRAAIYQYRCRVSDHCPDLTSSHLEFLAQYTGQPVETLKEHVLTVWKKAKTKLWVYKCVQEFTFLTPRISQHPHYELVQAAQRQQKHESKLLHLDTGCCFGQDTRQLLRHGWKQDQLMASDLVSDYWILGQDLFMDHKSLHVPFLTGSMTSSCVASASNPANPATGSLAGAFTFIWAAAVLHVLSKAECASFVTNTHRLLSEGGSLYGWTLGAKQAGASGKTPDGKQDRWAHSLGSLWDLLLHVGFSRVQIDLSDEALWGIADNSKDQLVLCFTAFK